ncbi:MAG: hypothetical protein A3K19_00790 [Lentisphaerae bacterium RIFOXYB12_FULL_65_16]|nr:MAG: hypothetical protein A3K18_14305 [Lentisphaerae bacterium RIFOXYA12_64_32]OGV86757.1 MAG: hypothetical protein A3K19_00790 [Lentisphaerae bacterium RIFOXYB12_FULL_65_16]
MRNVLKTLLVLVVFLGWGVSGTADPVVLEDFESLAGWKTNGKTESFDKADSAAVGTGAIHVKLPGMVYKDIASRPIEGSAAWDKYAGLSFWVKGDGSDQFGSLAVGANATGNYVYVYFFPLKDTTWHKETVAWGDLVPEGQYYPIGTPGAMPPSGIVSIRLGTRWTIWHNNGNIPRHEYCVDQIQIEESVAAPGPVPKPRAFQEVLDLLKAKKEIHVRCMGDSITAGTSLADKEKERYAVQMQSLLREWLGYDRIFVESRAVGGAKLTDACAWVPRDFVDTPPDLVTILYGYNDKSNVYLKPYFKDELNSYIDRILRKTEGKTAVLLLATLPGTGPRFVMMDDFADGVRETAQERGMPCCNLQKVFKEIGRDQVEEYFADMAHPNADGHRLLADDLASFLVQAAGIDAAKPRPKAEPPPAVPAAEHGWSFEGDTADWKIEKDEVSLCDDKALSGKAALRFAMKEPGKDHRRAYSPLFPVSERQRYRIEGKVFCGETTAGGIGVYVCTYTNDKGEGEPQAQCVKRASNVAGRWETVGDKFTVPPGAVAMKIMIWSGKESVGTFYVDDVKILPR